jgi:TPP-dependent pyruvate/acetoin dehydrogenase alpha subunit
MKWTPEKLIAFEDHIAEVFAQGNIPYPVHLGGGNERQLIDVFKTIKPDDYVLCGWRSHYHCLLKGIPPDELRAEIMKGHSVSLCFPKQKILCSGIVGGIAPIAAGIAWALKRSGSTAMVHVFLGDMSAEAGIVHEAQKYALFHDLPVAWIVEDNGVSVCTNTQESWGRGHLPSGYEDYRYHYELTRAHVGIDQWVDFGK